MSFHFYSKFLIHLLFFIRYYDANVEETRIKINKLIKKGEWNYDEFSDLKQNLQRSLNINN